MNKESSTLHNWAIEIQGLTKYLGRNAVLGGIDFKVGKGESITIFGPNGAGKTTLIKVLATIMNPSSGRILIDNLNVKNNAGEIRRRIGIVTHQTFLYNSLTAYENLKFYSRLYDIPNFKERIHEVVKMVGMISCLHERVGTLSRGMQQRLAIARSLIHKPDIMLLDEVETGLDQQAIAMLWEALRTKGESKRTIIFTSHNLERGLELCDRLLIIDKGEIVYEGSAEFLSLTELQKIYQHSTRVRT